MTTHTSFEEMQEASEHTLLSHKSFDYLVNLNTESECLAPQVILLACFLWFTIIVPWCSFPSEDGITSI
jgi:hypothetical protein